MRFEPPAPAVACGQRDIGEARRIRTGVGQRDPAQPRAVALPRNGANEGITLEFTKDYDLKNDPDNRLARGFFTAIGPGNAHCQLSHPAKPGEITSIGKDSKYVTTTAVAKRSGASIESITLTLKETTPAAPADGPVPTIACYMSNPKAENDFVKLICDQLMAPDATFPFGRLKLAFGFDRRTLEPKIATFDARLLVPPAFAELTTSSARVMPLTCGAESLGIAVIPASPRDGKFYETLGELFATILKVLDLRRRIPRVA